MKKKLLCVGTLVICVVFVFLSCSSPSSANLSNEEKFRFDKEDKNLCLVDGSIVLSSQESVVFGKKVTLTFVKDPTKEYVGLRLTYPKQESDESEHIFFELFDNEVKKNGASEASFDTDGFKFKYKLSGDQYFAGQSFYDNHEFFKGDVITFELNNAVVSGKGWNKIDLSKIKVEIVQDEWYDLSYDPEVISTETENQIISGVYKNTKVLKIIKDTEENYEVIDHKQNCDDEIEKMVFLNDETAFCCLRLEHDETYGWGSYTSAYNEFLHYEGNPLEDSEIYLEDYLSEGDNTYYYYKKQQKKILIQDNQVFIPDSAMDSFFD